MKIKHLKLDNTVSEVELAIDHKASSNLVMEYTVALLSRVRNQALKQGTKRTKDRAQVQGRSAKPYKQKGTGRARQGSRKGPHFVGGGVSHGPTMDTTKLYLNKKAKSVFMKRVLTDYINSEMLSLVEISDSGKSLRSFFSKYPKSLVVYSSSNSDNSKKLRNMKELSLISADKLNVYDLLGHKKILVDEKAQDILVNLLSK